MPLGFNIGRLGILNPGPPPKLKPPAIRTRSRRASPSDWYAVIHFVRKVPTTRRTTRTRSVTPTGFGEAQKIRKRLNMNRSLVKL